MKAAKKQATITDVEVQLYSKIRDADGRLRKGLRNYLGAVAMDDFGQINFWEPEAYEAAFHAATILAEFPRYASGLADLVWTAKRKLPDFEARSREHVNRSQTEE